MDEAVLFALWQRAQWELLNADVPKPDEPVVRIGLGCSAPGGPTPPPSGHTARPADGPDPKATAEPRKMLR